MRRGWFGEVTLNEGAKFRTELRGVTQALQQRLGEIYSPECRADLGDDRCKVDLGLWTRTGTVTGVIDGAATTDGWFNGGLLTWATGANAGRAIEVKSWTASTGRIELFMAVGYAIVIGDTFGVYPGCDKRLDTCIGRFNNVINFRGEPYVPGIDAMMQYPDAN